MGERIVLISGASGGLGRAVVDAFLENGDTVVGIARRPAKNPRPDYHAISQDLSEPAGAREAVRQAVGRFGRIDVLVHTMGAFAGGKPVAETEDDVWRKMLDVNLNAAFYLCREVLPHMIAAGRGRIVAVGSRTGVQPAPRLSAYGVSKAALNTLIQTIALEVRAQGVTANAVLPGTIDTEANREGASPGDIAKWVRPESIAGLIVWLASDAAADVNGALVPIYGES